MDCKDNEEAMYTLKTFLEDDMGYDPLLCMPSKYDDAFIGIDVSNLDRVAYNMQKLESIDKDWEKDYIELEKDVTDTMAYPIIVDTKCDCTGMKCLADLDDYIYGAANGLQLVYLYSNLIDGFVETQNMTEDEAIEWIEYNTLRALPYEGVDAPIVLLDYPEFSDKGDDIDEEMLEDIDLEEVEDGK